MWSVLQYNKGITNNCQDFFQFVHGNENSNNSLCSGIKQFTKEITIMLEIVSAWENLYVIILLYY
jgi:hypothetical protein